MPISPTPPSGAKTSWSPDARHCADPRHGRCRNRPRRAPSRRLACRQRRRQRRTSMAALSIDRLEAAGRLASGRPHATWSSPTPAARRQPVGAGCAAKPLACDPIAGAAASTARRPSAREQGVGRRDARRRPRPERSPDTACPPGDGAVDADADDDGKRPPALAFEQDAGESWPRRAAGRSAISASSSGPVCGRAVGDRVVQRQPRDEAERRGQRPAAPDRSAAGWQTRLPGGDTQPRPRPAAPGRPAAARRSTAARARRRARSAMRLGVGGAERCRADDRSRGSSPAARAAAPEREASSRTATSPPRSPRSTSGAG